ncbi:hypothetical protein AcW1_010257 [Taiwanofungus camphoratus]|nr:hypothetical protein AcW1_010257 [Antrodia cinnamomea]
MDWGIGQGNRNGLRDDFGLIARRSRPLEGVRAKGLQLEKPLFGFTMAIRSLWLTGKYQKRKPNVRCQSALLHVNSTCCDSACLSLKLLIRCASYTCCIVSVRGTKGLRTHRIGLETT